MAHAEDLKGIRIKKKIDRGRLLHEAGLESDRSCAATCHGEKAEERSEIFADVLGHKSVGDVHTSSLDFLREPIQKHCQLCSSRILGLLDCGFSLLRHRQSHYDGPSYLCAVELLFISCAG